MTDFDGQVWAAQDDDNVQFICISKRVKNKIQAVNEKGRDTRVSEEKLLWQYHSDVRDLNEWQNLAFNLQTIIDSLRSQIDIALLWETALDMQLTDINDIAELYFGGDVTAEHFVAIWRVLADDRLYFKRRGKVWEARTTEQITELKLQREREQARAKAQLLANEWLKNAAYQDSATVTPEILPFIERLECWLRGDTDKDISELIERIAESARLNSRELAFEVLQKSGRLPANADRDVIVAGLKPEFSTTVNEAAQAITHWNPPAEQKITDVFFSIDDEETREVDDALTIETDGDNWKITIAIADPSVVIHRGDVLDREAMRRGTTVYLPTQTVLMLPESVSCNIASLAPQQVRSAILLRAWLDKDANLINSSISREPIIVRRRLHYSDADKMLASTETDNDTLALQQLLNIAKQRQAQRLAEGAFNLQRPELKIKVSNGQVSVEILDKDSPSRLLVAEMMILANHIAAKYAQHHQVPIIYRTQESPLEPITPELLAEPLGFYRVRKLLRPSSLSLQPAGHSGLGLSAYTQLTSPLRRFADLVMQRQLVAHIVGEPLPYDQDELFKVLETAERTSRESRSVENDAKKRFFMQYLQESWSEQPFQAMLLDTVKGGYKVEMRPWGIDGFLGGNDRLELGQVVTVMVDKIRVRDGYARLKVV
ncbi:ribonuclease catalytic domain-containing protein [Beggiatoa leptomitoformis]|uniref:RNB domain-containing ribonuclease n=1 Tax=Beggiatoa leptomitoformis TaxID=288004 RepID=A0A2N9YHP5_9GAMM|nr:RNB domain-containing ribonuclease [Beggiatoa leptomitoformis]ALG67710.1 RNB domain-containing ribonuclease [Beggiatoa leptomitoformis]AUI70052.1 RNB domain-containing ribonuclease [Beggiatoa leptomitoformis]